jgi:hypothetical protein
MGLRDWTFEIVDGNPDPADAIATCEPIEGRRIARLRFSVRFESLPVTEKRHAVVHELVHAHLAQFTDDAHSFAKGSTGYAVAWPMALRSLEYAVDGLAEALAPTMPLP